MNARARAEFEILKDKSRCINCGICQKQCANKVYELRENGEWLIADERCVNCQRCVEMCPTGALKVIKNRNEPRSDGNWQLKAVREIYKQAETGGTAQGGYAQNGQPGYDESQQQMGGGFCEQCATCCACNMLFNCCLNACCGCR